MSLDRSLKAAGGSLSKHRNVLTRAERIGRLKDGGKFELGKSSPLGLIKIGNRKAKVVKVAKKDAAAPAAGAAAAPAAGAKAAAPAAKAAAPAAKAGAKK